MKVKHEIEVGLTSSDIQRILDGEELVCWENGKMRVYVKSWCEPKKFKLRKVKKDGRKSNALYLLGRE